MVTTSLKMAKVNYTEPQPFRWYGMGDGPAYAMERHGVDRNLRPGDSDVTLCGLDVTIDPSNPNRVGRRTCAECSRLWRVNTGLPELPVQPEGPES